MSETLSETLDRIRAKRRGGDVAGGHTPTPDELDKARRERETYALEVLSGQVDRRREGKRLAAVRRALLDEVSVLRHGQTYKAAEQGAIVDRVMRKLGTNAGGIRERVEQLVSSACDDIASGDLISGVRRCDDVAEDIAKASDTVGEPRPTSSKADEVADDDPTALAALIPRA
jgi:hypothetical protein